MKPTSHTSYPVLLLTLIAVCLLLFSSRQSVRAQVTTLSKPEVDRMLYVSNAFDIMERNNTPELVGLAFTINAAYQNHPDYPADRMLQELQNATARYNAYYRSALHPEQTRFAIGSGSPVYGAFCATARAIHGRATTACPPLNPRGEDKGEV
jgi:hypothetical protein